jgi:hypothetical protein
MNAAAGLVAEHVITVRGLFEGRMVDGEAGDTERVAAVADDGHEVIDPALDVRLSRPQRYARSNIGS